MIYTFYSFKGGVGRSMALANVAQHLYLQGLNVLMVDWDLEAPGIEEFFFDKPEDLESATAHPGLIDLLLAYKRTYPSIKPRLLSVAPLTKIDSSESPDEPDFAALSAVRQKNVATLRTQLPPLSEAVFTVHSRSESGEYGSLKLLTAGWRAGAQFQEYAAAVQSFDWAGFYAAFDGEAYFDWLRDGLNSIADVVLVDSRTGVTEMGGVCTRHLADVVVCLCAPNRQNLRGLVDMIRSFQRSALIQARGRGLAIVAVPTRVENSEISLLNQFADQFVKRLELFTPPEFKRANRTFWDLRIPYVPRYAYSETLAIGAQDTAGDLESAYKTLATHLLLLAPDELIGRGRPDLAAQVKTLYPQEQQQPGRRVFLIYMHQDAAVGRKVADALLSPPDEASRLLVRGLSPAPAEISMLAVDGGAPSGGNWLEWTTHQIDRAQAVVAILTPRSLASREVDDVLMAARVKGTRLVLVLGVPMQELDPSALPLWLRPLRLFDPEHEWPQILAALYSDERPLRVPSMAPSSRGLVLPRPAVLEKIVSRLLSEGGEVVMIGAAGMGKTSLAATVCRDERIVEKFYDGVLWATLGRQPHVLVAITELYVALTSDRPSFLSVVDAMGALQEVLSARRCLIVVDDVWAEEDVRPFLHGAPFCARLVTTRNRNVARLSQFSVEIDALDLSSSIALLEADLGVAGQDVDLAPLAQRLGGVPLLVRMTSDALRHRIRLGDTVTGAVEYARKALDKRGLTAFDREKTLAATLQQSLDWLAPPEQEKTAMLAAFPDGREIPLAAAQALWDVDELDAEDLAQRLDALSLVRFRLPAKTIAVHPAISDFLRSSFRPTDAIQRQAAELMEAIRPPNSSNS